MSFGTPIRTIENIQSQIYQGNLSVSEIVKQSLLRIHDSFGQGKALLQCNF
jgi:hypothetical protein